MNSTRQGNGSSSCQGEKGRARNNSQTNNTGLAFGWVHQACMRPCPPDAMPIMGEVPGAEGLYIAAGHNCWGILWAPITGLAMAELMVDGQSSVNLAPFTLQRFMARAKGGRGRKNVNEAVGEQW